MTAPHATQIVEGYLARLNAELAELSAGRRHELVEDVREHITEARATLQDETDAALLNILDHIGEPSEIAKDAREREEGRSVEGRVEERKSQEATAAVSQGWGWVEVAAIVLTILVWPAGVILVWLSRVWSRQEKLVGTLIGAVAFVISFPLFGPLIGPIMGRIVGSVGGAGPLLISALGIFNVIGAAYLAVRLSRRESALSRSLG
jgi:uncharacterized membrane protein